MHKVQLWQVYKCNTQCSLQQVEPIPEYSPVNKHGYTNNKKTILDPITGEELLNMNDYKYASTKVCYYFFTCVLSLVPKMDLMYTQTSSGNWWSRHRRSLSQPQSYQNTPSIKFTNLAASSYSRPRSRISWSWLEESHVWLNYCTYCFAAWWRITGAAQNATWNDIRWWKQLTIEKSTLKDFIICLRLNI